MKLFAEIILIAVSIAFIRTQNAPTPKDDQASSGGKTEIEADKVGLPLNYSSVKHVLSDMLKNKSAEDALTLIGNYPDAERRIYGYYALHEVLEENNELDQPALVAVAFALRKIMAGLNSDSSALPAANRLKDKLPKSVKNLAFANCTLFRRTAKSEDMYAPIDQYKKDRNRRRIFTWIPGEPQNHGHGCWRASARNSTTYFIENTDFKEYLYAAYGNFKFDDERRSVFTWTPGGTDRQCEWSFEPSGENIYVKNNLFGEYLIADSEKTYDQRRRYVFTLMSKEKSDDGLWEIVDGEED